MRMSAQHTSGCPGKEADAAAARSGRVSMQEPNAGALILVLRMMLFLFIKMVLVNFRKFGNQKSIKKKI